MANDSSTICFRVPIEERDLLEAVAHYSDQTLSSFARTNLLAAAHGILLEVGPDAVMKKDREFEQQRIRDAADKLKNRHESLERRGR